MYNTNFVCTYNTSEIFLEDDQLNDDEKLFVRNAIYRQEFLNILGIETIDDASLDNKMHELYNKVSENDFIKECMIKLSSRFLTSNEEFGLTLMYSYDYMYLTHICISEFLDTGIITENNKTNLRNIIF